LRRLATTKTKKRGPQNGGDAGKKKKKIGRRKSWKKPILRAGRTGGTIILLGKTPKKKEHQKKGKVFRAGKGSISKEESLATPRDRKGGKDKKKKGRFSRPGGERHRFKRK